LGLTADVTLRDVVVRRRMVRAFTDEPVDPVVVDELLDLGRRAPSAGNSQGTAFVRPRQAGGGGRLLGSHVAR
jgi:nitroreductase